MSTPMTSAKERAVEAGARAMARDHYEVRFGPGDRAEININANWHIFADPVRIALCAAFPILAEDVLDAAAAYLRDTYGASYGLDHPVDRERIRARIQQMAEAL